MKISAKIIFFSLALFLAASSFSALAKDTPYVPGTQIPYQNLTSKFNIFGGGYWGPLLTCTGDYSATSSRDGTYKTCTSACDVIIEFEAILYFALTLVMYVGAPVMLVVGAGMIMFAGANPNLLSQGRKVLFSTVIGVVLALASYVIVSTFLWLVQPADSAKPVSWPNITCNPKDAPGGELDFSSYNYKAPTSTTGTPPPASSTPPSVSSGCYNGTRFPAQFKCFPGTNDCGGGTYCGSGLKCSKYSTANCSGHETQ